MNFRQIPGTDIYALGQPTIEAIDDVLARIRKNHPHASKIVWITLREEPIVYINGTPYCLRRENYSLRNMKDYGGISASRLEILEDRLRDDVISELDSFGGWCVVSSRNLFCFLLTNLKRSFTHRDIGRYRRSCLGGSEGTGCIRSERYHGSTSRRRGFASIQPNPNHG